MLWSPIQQNRLLLKPFSKGNSAFMGLVMAPQAPTAQGLEVIGLVVQPRFALSSAPQEFTKEQRIKHLAPSY